MKRIFFSLVSILLLALGSCKKALTDIPETDAIAGALALSSVTYVEQAVLGAYSPLSPDMNILLNAVFSDEVTRADFYNAQSTHEWQYGPADVGLRDSYTAIGPLYTAINRANLALAALPNADSTRAGDNTKRSILRGELLFIRAWAHFDLFRYYSGNYEPSGLAMPYMETSSILPSPRIAMGPYFQKLNADLATAKTLVPASLADINRANYTAVAGLQARVALYMRDWANAEIFATQFITAVPLADRTTFPLIWKDSTTAEQAFRYVKTNTIGSRIGSLFRGTSASATTTGIGVITWKPSEKLWSSYDQATDIRFNSYLRNESLLAGSTARSSTRLIFKYAGSTYGTANENVANGKLLRTGEMYLIRAEARAELNKLTGSGGADEDVNVLRNARISSGYTNVTYTSRQQAIDDILLERFKELAYEGHRFFDLKRRGLPVERLPADVTGSGARLPANDFRFVLPIPLPEVTANPTLQQNPGYF